MIEGTRMKAFTKTFIVCIAIALAGAVLFGCSSPSTSNRGTNENATHTKEYYEGWWACSGYQRNGSTVSFSLLSSQDKETFPYLSIDLQDGKLGSVMQTENGSGDPETLLMGEWEPTSNGVKIGNVEFALKGDKLTLEKDGITLFFENCVFGSQLHVGTIFYKGISFDAPIDLAFIHDGLSTDSKNYNIATSYRAYGPSLSMSARPADAQDITEMTDYFADHEDCFTSFNGMNYFVFFDADMLHSDIEFIRDGIWYTIEFSYFSEDPIDYSNYAETFYTTIQFTNGTNSGNSTNGSNSSSAGSITPKAESKGAAPAGAIAWQEAPQHIGETVTVYGPVVDIDFATSSNGQPTFIDLGAAYPSSKRVTIVIWGEDRGAFPSPPESMYAGKTLYVTGELYVYNNACNIKVTSPSQIKAQ